MGDRTPFRLGFMLRIPTPWNGSDAGDTVDVRQMFANALTLAEAADQLGFDSLWLTQHHFGAVDSALPSPLVFHAAVAARTRHIRLGTTVITAPLEHPIRLAEDAATLDVISGGRVEVGLGTRRMSKRRGSMAIRRASACHAACSPQRIRSPRAEC
jgi:alkanesulfonate monooxygenase SsuD/methylene tetrahydromethanopterin reductase-like flavin-dependent oxidoreductase (luciferase family)